MNLVKGDGFSSLIQRGRMGLVIVIETHGRHMIIYMQIYIYIQTFGFVGVTLWRPHVRIDLDLSSTFHN